MQLAQTIAGPLWDTLVLLFVKLWWLIAAAVVWRVVKNVFTMRNKLDKK